MEKIITNPKLNLTITSNPLNDQYQSAQPIEIVSPDFLDDESMMQLLVLKDANALAGLYDRYGRLVYSIAFASFRDQSIAEEIVQDVFTQVWKKADTYNASIARVHTWLVSITRHKVIDMLRRERAHPERNGVDLLEVSDREDFATTRPEDDAELFWRKEQVREALNTLPPNERKPLALAYFKGYSQTEIARILGLPLGTVKTRIRFAMKKLRLYLSQTIQD